jgi:phosphotransferase system enzyme I (PtsP)
MTPKKELEILHQIADVVACTLDLKELLARIAKMIVSEVGSNACLIYLYDEQSDALILSGAHSPHAAALGKVRLKPGEGITPARSST